MCLYSRNIDTLNRIEKWADNFLALMSLYRSLLREVKTFLCDPDKLIMKLVIPNHVEQNEFEDYQKSTLS